MVDPKLLPRRQAWRARAHRELPREGPAPGAQPAPTTAFAYLLADRRLSTNIQRRHATRGEFLFIQGQEAAGLWLLEKGRVRIYTSDAEGHEQTLQIIGPGESFNEVPFFDLGPEPATAAVLEDSRLLVVPQVRRDVVLGQVPELARLAAEQFAARLRQAVSLIADLSFRQVSGRVALVLLQAVEPHMGVGAGNATHPVTQREIAEMAGTSREVVARALRRLEREGLIRIERGRILILDREGLARHA